MAAFFLALIAAATRDYIKQVLPTVPAPLAPPTIASKTTPDEPATGLHTAQARTAHDTLGKQSGILIS